MYISNSLIELIISRCTIEYSGTHAPYCPKLGNKGLWGRAAYWRVYMPRYGFACKITAPVKSLNPRKATLDKLLRAELRRRIEAIQETCETNHYGEVCVYMKDPYSMCVLVESIQGAYTQWDEETNNLKIKFFGTGSHIRNKEVKRVQGD